MSIQESEQKTDLAQWLKMVEELRHAPEWPEDEKPIEMKQTHISVLLLGRKHVIKLKKPVDFGFLDYTTLAKRSKAVEDEVRLNRRLCPETYIGYGGVIETDGKIGFSGRHGKIVDYCVWMHRLPEDRMLDRMVAEGTVTDAVIERIAARLAEFHRTAMRGPEIAGWGSLAEIRYNWEENFEQTEGFVGRTISAAEFATIRDWARQWLTDHAELFDRRVREGKIVDGHGDLRCESICVKDEGVCIYDCIDFNDRFRCGDVAGEAAFLAMDLDARGRPDLGYHFTEEYQWRRGDSEFFKLLPFYRCYRAYVRGKVLSFRLNEPEFSRAEHEAAIVRARNYFDLARRYAERLRKPTMIVVGGLSGTGKTSVARAVAGELGLRVISADAVRQSLFGDAKQESAYGEGAYTGEANQATYQKLLELSRPFLTEDHGVILDATFRQKEDLAAALELAEALGAQSRFIECRLEPEQVRARLEKPYAQRNGLSDATWDIYLHQREEQKDLKGLQAPVDTKRSAHLILETSGTLGTTARVATDWLRKQEQSA